MPQSTERQIPTPWLNAKEAAAYLGISLGTLRNWTSAKFVPFSKRGGIVRYHQQRLDEWLTAKSCRGRSKFVSDEHRRPL